MILLEVIWWLFFTFQHREQFVFTFPDKLYMLANHTHTHTIDAQSTAAKEMEGGRKSEGGYIDEAWRLLFSLLISLNLLIPILKPTTLQCWRLLCVAPSQIKLSFMPALFKDHSSISSAFPPCVSIALIYSQTLCVKLVTSDTSVTYSCAHALQ